MEKHDRKPLEVNQNHQDEPSKVEPQVEVWEDLK